ncbi:hypothetical protein BN1051_02669 [Arthrobacter saudimassiliensis]|uniref:Uncharacterized protein n=1 Tax=Arthrobacter saudimassiliensis TaxID=1461584 RepID=A0A078MWU4_9MICC|nr:hypothetical protein BN1051_02669 [Arthrobacter saudimassiliensis]
MGRQHNEGRPPAVAAADLADAARAMEAAGIPDPKAYAMTLLRAAETLYITGEPEEGAAACEQAWAYAESVPALTYDRELAIHLFTAAWDLRTPRDPYYLIGAFPLAVEEYGPGSPWVRFLLRELSLYVEDIAEWGQLGSVRDDELAAHLQQIAEQALREFPVDGDGGDGDGHGDRSDRDGGDDAEIRRLRAAVAGHATVLLFYTGSHQWRESVLEWLDGPIYDYSSGSEQVRFLLGLQTYEAARAAAERTLAVVDADPVATDGEKALTVLDVAFGIALAPDDAGLARLPELEERAGSLAAGSLTDAETYLVREKMYRYVAQRMTEDEDEAAQAAQREMFERLRFDPFAAPAGAEA